MKIILIDNERVISNAPERYPSDTTYLHLDADRILIVESGLPHNILTRIAVESTPSSSVTFSTLVSLLASLSPGDQVAYCGNLEVLSHRPWLPFNDDASRIAPWISDPTFPTVTAQEVDQPCTSWVSTWSHLGQLLAAGSDPRHVIRNALSLSIGHHSLVRWSRPTVPNRDIDSLSTDQGKGSIQLDSSVLVVIPHYACEAWLDACLASVVHQTRPPQAVVVLDDASARPPSEIVARFPSVSLFRSSGRVGPYALAQSVIDQSKHEVIMFQDADDWSSVNRLEHLLAVGAAKGADCVGSQELRVDDSSGAIKPVLYPLDVNTAFQHRPANPLLHPTSIVSRRLIERVNGFSTGLRYGADTEFLFRAIFCGKIVNVDAFHYYRRIRPDSLTGHPDTGLGSTPRIAFWTKIFEHAMINLARQRSGALPELAPCALAPSCNLEMIAGPHIA